MEKNLTTGSVFKTIVSFSLPFLLSYFLQTLYGMADLFIIGQFYGVDSTTAVSIGSQVMHMLTVMIVGLAMGSTVLIGRAVGARWQYSRPLPVPLCPRCRPAALDGRADCIADVHPGRSGVWHSPLSDYLFPGDSFYHGI